MNNEIMTSAYRDFEYKQLQIMKHCMEQNVRLKADLHLQWELDGGVPMVTFEGRKKGENYSIYLPLHRAYIKAILPYLTGKRTETIPQQPITGYDSSLIRDFDSDAEVQMEILSYLWPLVNSEDIQKYISPGDVYFFIFNLKRGKIKLFLRDKCLTPENRNLLYNLIGAEGATVNNQKPKYGTIN